MLCEIQRFDRKVVVEFNKKFETPGEKDTSILQGKERNTIFIVKKIF